METFGKRSRNPDGLHEYCKPCNSIAALEYYKENREQKRQTMRNYWERTKAERKEYRKTNAERISQQQKEWRQANKEKKKEIQAAWYKANKERARAISRQWQQANKDRIKDKDKRKWNTDPQYRMAKLLRSRLLNAILHEYKTGSAVRDLGCSIAELLSKLDQQCLDRYGEVYSTAPAGRYHIDHIQPLASFDLTNPAEVKKAVHYSNLQVLLAEENLRKGARVSDIANVDGQV